MKGLSKSLLFIYFYFLSSGSWAQSDTTSTEVARSFSFEEFMEQVLLYHPVVKQVFFLSDLAKQELRLARGNFDPKLKSDLGVKEFNGKTYYDIWDSKLEVPIWFNTDLNIGYERNQGQYLSPHLSNTENGLIYAGVTVPLGRGLFTDERRVAVQQAKQLQGMAEADKVKEINKVLLNASKVYWNWYYTFQNYQIISEVEDLAETRYRGIVQQVVYGDIAPFDSLKAFINYQERRVQRKQASLSYENAVLQVSNYLWDELNDEVVPLEVANGTHPVAYEGPDSLMNMRDLEELKFLAIQNHPDLLKLDFKINQLEYEQRLNREFLKPEVNLKYNFLTKTAPMFSDNSNGGSDVSYFTNNYKLGLQVFFPLFLRKERAKLEMTNIKLEQNFYQRSFRRNKVLNDIDTAYNTVITLKELIELQSGMADNYQALLNGEITKFENGESSVFLINTRETELLDVQVKLLKLQTKYEKARLEMLYAAGVPYLNFSPDLN